ncbi:MAG: hypothetical protein NXI30_03975 [bacterium]|nr:hypothetical protein [bacterium]
MTDDQRRVAGAAGLLAASVLIARVLGLLRDALLASQLGLGPEVDVYYAAFMIPDILGYLLAAGAVAVAITPPYVKRLEHEGQTAAARFASVVVGTVGGLATGATIVLWLQAEPLMRLQFPDFDDANLAEAVRLTRIVLPAQIFFLTGGVLRGVLMAHGRFAPQAWASIVYSAAPIGGALVAMALGVEGRADGFAWGTLVGAIVGQWAIPVFALRRLPGAVGRIRVAPLDRDFREYAWLALPLMLGLGLTTVDEWYEKWLGATIAPGAIAAITLARKLMMVPVGIVGQAVGAALLPSLTTRYQQGDDAGFGELLTTTLRTCLGLGLVAAGGLAALALPAVRLVYEYGRFEGADSLAVAGLLVVLAAAIPGWVVQQVAVRGFYARGEMWLAMGLSTGIALAVFPLYWMGARGQGVQGLAAASATAISMNAILTLVWLHVRAGSPDPLALVRTLVRGLLVVALAGVVTVLALGLLREALPWAIAQLAVGGAFYGIVALVGIRFFGDEALREGIEAVLARLRRGSRSDPE